MSLVYINPEEAIHPLRHELDDEQMADILRGVENDENWMSADELDAALDYLFDYIASKKQTHLGEVTLQ